jgi:soluble lytic murein transglycosylase-like protein
MTPERLIRQAANEQGLPADFVASVARVESAMRQRAVSPRGAIGLMQLMPATAAELGVNAQLDTGNAEGGAKYLRILLLKYRGDSALALAAYDAGPGAVARFGGIPPYEETRRYVVKVLREYAREQKHRPGTESVAER